MSRRSVPGRLDPLRGRRRWTVRLRLTAVYGALFLASGVVLLAITYALVNAATGTETVTVVLPDGQAVSGSVDVGDPPLGSSPEPETSEGSEPGDAGTSGGDPVDIPDPQALHQLAAEQHAARMRTLLTRSAVALGVTTIVALGAGWLVAGQILRPVRTITTATRRISARNLDERLSLAGPHDELRELGDTIDDLLARLDRAFTAQRRFVANASHELRTPLARQRTIAQVALDDPAADTTTLRAAHERVLAAGTQQEHLIDALLTLARSQDGLRSGESVDLAPLAGAVVDGCRDDAGARGVRLVADLGHAPVMGDARLLERLVVNLVDNAVRHNEPGGTAEVRVTVDDHRPVLRVWNTGALVPPDAVESLFQPFRRLEPGRTHQGDGHGLGLSIVRAVADAHGASVDARAQPGGGLDVRVSFHTPPAPPPTPTETR